MQLLSSLFLIIYSLAVVGTIVVIVTDNRNPLKTVPWIIVLLLAPVVGLVCYFFFGQNLSKQRIISRRTRRRVTAQLRSADEAGCATVPAQWEPLSELLDNTMQAVPLYGSRITTYTDGRSKMDALCEAIDAARDHIHLQYYIFSDDATGCDLRDRLIRKAREGVEVRILYDDVGCARVKKRFFNEMQRAGIEVYSFLNLQFPFFTSKGNYRNHRKIAVIDGRVGFLGGMNIADRYVHGPGWGTWRDTHFRIEGGGVAGLQAAFLSDWSATTKRPVTDARYYPETLHYADGATMQIVAGGPFGKWRALLQGGS
ncbi:MAG: PLDc N-terminal domain-containing protein, partial [Alistipes sp.]|nr:PLDc N-terminal domain-containing protein [Alistipes sp.]